MEQLSDIREACARLRRLPESLWTQSPRAPLGARAPHEVPDATGPDVETQVRGLINELMLFDADRRGVSAYAVTVGAFARPDVLEALAKSVAAAHGAAAADVLSRVAVSSARL